MRNIFNINGNNILDLKNWKLYSEKIDYIKNEKSFYYLKEKNNRQISLGVFYNLGDMENIKKIAWGFKNEKDCSYNASVEQGVNITNIVSGCPCDFSEPEKNSSEKYFSKKYLPIYFFLFNTIIISVIYTLLFKNLNIMNFMSSYMGFFFIIFGTLKMVNLKNFSIMFSTYDLIASRVKFWGYVYPFIEIFLGLSYLVLPINIFINSITFILMCTASFSIYKKLKSNIPIQCACLGGFFNIPLSWITFWENFIMFLMSFFMFF